MPIDVGSRNEFPGGPLSNFSPHFFVFRGVSCSSMEGLLQSLKFEDPEEQIEVCTLIGFVAKRRGRPQQWFESQTLWWQGKPINRHSPEFQELLDEAFEALFTQNEKAREALLATGEEILIHTVGKSDPHETVLTEEEFCSRLMRIRTILQESTTTPA